MVVNVLTESGKGFPAVSPIGSIRLKRVLMNDLQVFGFELASTSDVDRTKPESKL